MMSTRKPLNSAKRCYARTNFWGIRISQSPLFYRQMIAILLFLRCYHKEKWEVIAQFHVGEVEAATIGVRTGGDLQKRVTKRHGRRLEQN